MGQDQGWICIHRKLKKHWLWHDEKRLKWWLDIVLSVNHEDNKVLIKGKLIECKRGQSVKSLESWAKDWRTSKKTVRCFFELLSKDEMLGIESVTVSTRITVCKYGTYNISVNADDPAHFPAQGTRGKRTLPPNNNDNNDNKDNNDKQEKYTRFLDFWKWYGKSADKKKCQDKFLKLELDEIEKILQHVPQYVRSTPDIQFRKNPLTYINGKCWNDEIIQAPQFLNNPLFVPTGKYLD